MRTRLCSSSTSHGGAPDRPPPVIVNVSSLGRVIRVRSQGGRDRVVAVLRRGSLKTRSRLQGSGWNVPQGAFLFTVAGLTGGAAVSGMPQDALRASLATMMDRLPWTLTLRRRRCTLVMEQRWRALNRAKLTLRHLHPVDFDFLLLRRVDALNQAVARERCA